MSIDLIFDRIEKAVKDGLSKKNKPKEVDFSELEDGKYYDLISQGGEKVLSNVDAQTIRQEYDKYDGVIIAKSDNPCWSGYEMYGTKNKDGKQVPNCVKKGTDTFSNYPSSAVNEAKRALEWKEKHGSDVKGGTQVGWIRANQIAGRKPLSMNTIKRIAQFQRHEKNSGVAPEYKDEPWKDRGNVAYMLWGGQSMIDWAKRIIEQHEKKD